MVCLVNSQELRSYPSQLFGRNYDWPEGRVSLKCTKCRRLVTTISISQSLGIHNERPGEGDVRVAGEGRFKFICPCGADYPKKVATLLAALDVSVSPDVYWLGRDL